MEFKRCRAWLDYGKKKRCPIDDVTNCLTPNLPPNCPLKKTPFKRPCYRFRCSHEDDEELQVVRYFCSDPFINDVIMYANLELCGCPLAICLINKNPV